MSPTAAVLKRELAAYFTTPLAYVFLVVFLVLAGALPFYAGDFYERGQADLAPFFGFHPWLYAFLMPALAMRLWAEERAAGTLELLLSLPLSARQAVLGKFLAAWLFTLVAIAATAPMGWTVNYLGDPDNGVIAASYIASALVAGAFLAIGAFVSALTRSQVIAFVAGFAACFVLLLAGYPVVVDALRSWAPSAVVDALGSLSVQSHFDAIRRGVLELRDLVYFAVVIALFVFANAVAVEIERAR